MKKSFIPLTLAFSITALAATEAGRKPNIVVIIADDLGYADLGMQGSATIPTPHIDSIARNGVRFTDAYASAPVCAPSRAGLLTGRHQQRFGFEFNSIADKDMPPGVAFGLPLGEKTLAGHLKSSGYATGLVGKWHLGDTKELHPLGRGFDEFYGFLEGASRYLPAGRPFPPGADPGTGEKEQRIMRGRTPIVEEEYLTDAFGREAVTFIDRHHAGPFFLYLAFNAPHVPLQATENYLRRFAGQKFAKERQRHYAAMISAMDDNIGRVLEALRRHGLEDDTLVFFASDNGGTPGKGGNAPLRGYKQDVWEGGIRVPFCLQWKNRLPAGRVERNLVSLLDITPTALAAAGVAPGEKSRFDGADLIPLLAGESQTAPHDALFWRYGTKECALRAGDWKAVRNRTPDWQLYNLAADIGEETDLAAAQPEKFEQLRRRFSQWSSTMSRPLWIKKALMDEKPSDIPGKKTKNAAAK
ncbi:MAG: sulfatase [Opitutaceae bacterium]|jgi:arylsulfatase A-like enzyme|nr:sulfatase [Opitutaceae bacterium]